MAQYICDKFGNSTATVDAVFCSRRHKRALDIPDDFSLEPCRTCDKGKTAWETLGIEAKPNPTTVPCKLCGESTNDLKNAVCSACKKNAIKKKFRKAVNRDRNPLSVKDDEHGKTVNRVRNPLSVKDDEHGQRIRKKGEIMPAVTSEKICVDCKETYAPTSNVQKRCTKCKAIHEAKRQKEYALAHYDKRKSQVSRERVPRQQKAAHLPQGNIGPLGGRESEPENKIRSEGKNGKAACMAQMLYSSKLLDEQINTALETGDIDTKAILDIRMRLGEVLRASIPEGVAA